MGGDMATASYQQFCLVAMAAEGTGNTSVLLWDHVLDAVAWVAGHDTMSNRGLLANVSGTCTGITPLNRRDSAEADFDPMKKVRACFVDA